MPHADTILSQKVCARAGGFAYLYIIAAGIFAQAFVRSKLAVPGDAAATAENILASEFLFRAGFASELLLLVADVIVAFVLYVLLKPIDRNLALLAAMFRLAMTAISAANSFNHYYVLLFLNEAEYLTVFGVEQLQAFALHSLRAHALGYHVSLVFFGFHCLLIGWLIFKSIYIPRLIGLLLIVASACYLTNSFATILFPDFARMLSSLILLPALIAELSLALWLIVKGASIPEFDE